MRVLTLGTFDGIHAGHRYLFARAAELGELIVGVNSDRFVANYKGDPQLDEAERIKRVASCAGVSRVELNDGPGRELIQATRPDILVIGGDWHDRDYAEQIDIDLDELREVGCAGIYYVGRLPGISSSALKASTVTAVVVTHANPDGAERAIAGLLTQTRPPDEIILVATETSQGALAELEAMSAPPIRVYSIDDVGDFGHAKRARGLELATGDWIAFVNDDDVYADTYLERMLGEAADDVDVVYCGWNENPGCDFAIYQSTAGNFIVRRGLAQWVGWLGRDYEADGHFIEALKAADARVTKVDEILYWHNETEIPAAAR